MTTRLLTTLLFAGLVSTAGPSAADTVSLTSSRDNTLYETSDGTLSSGAGPTMFVGRTAQGFEELRRALVAFDLADSIPAGSTVVSVEIELHMSKTISGAQTVTLHRVTSSWGEGASNAGLNGGAGALSVTGDATWLHRSYDAELWSSAGGDFDAAASASASVAGIGDYAWGSTPGLVADVQGWVDNPASNHGWLVLGNENATGSAKRFNTREHPSASSRPRLIVTFNPPGVAVEAASWSRIKVLYGDLD
jgi:hypothetical protein